MCCSVTDMDGAHIPNSSTPVTSNQPETSLHTINFPVIGGKRVGNSRSDEGAVTDEMDADGFITVRTKREKRAIKYSNTVDTEERNRSESSNCKSVSRAILLKQSS
jgi:hypothetical protein